ncbi:MAG TPA: hypothetical protein VFQ53_07420 [Kofleriaceae bacterium]|nr:hypothetical protein [Kofleriaceae bacterium]
MTADDIRAFHRGAYHLANMGMIGAFPSGLALDEVLERTGDILERTTRRTAGKVSSEGELPAPEPAAAGTIRIVEYPYADATNPGPMLFAWPATRRLDDGERMLMALFLDAFAGDESTTLYKKLIDSQSRVLDVGANGVWSYTTNDQGQPVFVGLSGVKADRLDERTVAEVRALVLAELARIAELPAGDGELAALVARVRSRVVDTQRRLNKFLDSPPGFGFRGTSAGWMEHLHSLSKSGGFRKSLTMRPALAAIRGVLDAEPNPWRERLAAWGLLDVPFGVAAKPSPARRQQLDAERKQRIDDELARLQARYGTADVAEALARYEQAYDAETAKLEASAKAMELPPLVESLPMTLDDGLRYELGSIGTVPMFAATFDSMASARVQLVFRVNDRLVDDDLMYLGALPALLGDVGVIVDGEPIAADEMRERMRQEILEMSVYFADHDRTRRVELVFAGAGNGADETRAALGWMRRVMFAPDWRIENVSRLRDLVDQGLTALRTRMLGAEEGWVNDPRDAWRHQSPLQAHTASFLTQSHDLHRLRWQLLDPRDAAVTAEVVRFFASLAEAGTLPRAQLAELAQGLAQLAPGQPTPAGTLSDAARALAIEAGKDLAALVGELPDGSLAADWTYLCRQMARDLEVGLPAVLAKLERIRATLLRAPQLRIVVVGSTASRTALAPAIEALVREIPDAPSPALSPTPARIFEARLRAREPAATTPMFVGLVAPGTSSGVFVNCAPAPWYGDTDDDAVLDTLAANLYTGHGGHSLFMKTWAAGLAYSNGVRPSVDEGLLVYYAERTPLLPQTLRFVIDELRKARPDDDLARYAVASAFHSRIANGYESRASAMAANLVDGQTPEVVRAFRTRVLELAQRPDLTQRLYERLERVYGKVLPGYGTLEPRATYFVIGPEPQLAAYEEYLRVTFGAATTLHRLYPRDFWIPATL